MSKVTFTLELETDEKEKLHRFLRMVKSFSSGPGKRTGRPKKVTAGTPREEQPLAVEAA